jgi:hypothetical protein
MEHPCVTFVNNFSPRDRGAWNIFVQNMNDYKSTKESEAWNINCLKYVYVLKVRGGGGNSQIVGIEIKFKMLTEN